MIQKQEGTSEFLDLEMKIRSSGMLKISQKAAQVSFIWKFQKCIEFSVRRMVERLRLMHKMPVLMCLSSK